MMSGLACDRRVDQGTLMFAGPIRTTDLIIKTDRVVGVECMYRKDMIAKTGYREN